MPWIFSYSMSYFISRCSCFSSQVTRYLTGYPTLPYPTILYPALPYSTLPYPMLLQTLHKAKLAYVSMTWAILGSAELGKEHLFFVDKLLCTVSSRRATVARSKGACSAEEGITLRKYL